MTTPSLPRAGQPVDFDTVAGVYDSVFAAHIAEHYLRRRSRYIVGLASGGAAGATALDVGAGTGVLAERLAGLGLEVVALDPFPGMLDQLRRRRPDLRAVQADGDAIPFPDDTFDLTYCVAVMHHIADPDRVRATIAEMVRVTRPGGKILVWDHNPLNPYWPLLMRRVPQDNGTERLIPLVEIVAGMRGGGAEIVRAERLGLIPEFVPGRLLRAAAAVERAVEATPGLRRFCAHNVVVAGKP